jgi:hypothetical protein
MTRRDPAVVIAAFLAAWSISRGAEAAPSARLVYARGPGVESCPDESVLRAAVAVRMGYDPFLPAAELVIRVEMTAEGQHLRGRIILETGGIEKGSQTIDEPRREGVGASCEDLVTSIALAVSVALDADKVPVVAAPTPPADPAVPVKEVAAPAVVPAATTEGKPGPAAPVTLPRVTGGPSLSLWVAPGLRASYGAWPAVSVAPDLFAELRSGRFGVGIEGRYDLPVTLAVGSNGSGQASVQRAMGSALPCAHIGWFTACGVASFGETWAKGGANVEGPVTANALYAAFGGRVGVDVPLVPRFHLLGTVDLVGIATQTPVAVGNVTTSGGPVEGSAGIALLVSIF